MSPALTKLLKDGHGIFLSSPVASNEQSQYFQKMVFSVLPSLDSYLQPIVLDLPSNTGVTTGQLKSLTRPSPNCLALSYNNSITKCQQLASTSPGVSHMCGNGQEGCLKSACTCRPGASDVSPPHSLSSVSAPFLNGDYNSVLAPIIISNHENCSLDPRVSGLKLQNQMKKRASRQKDLHSQALKLQRRLHALLGQHASLHCNQQLEELRKGSDLRGFFAGAELSQAVSEQLFTWLETSPQFSQCSQAVLKGLQEALDSEATASSSSDDEAVETQTHGEYRKPSVASACFEKKWLKERAELSSRWTWLLLRVAELEGRIQQLTELHKNICSARGCVRLADMTDQQVKNALLSDMAAFSGAALDADNEPCSPTHLLHSIERQSAQLSKIVNSLMPPLNLSPLSKPWQPWEDKRAFNRDVFVSGSSKRRNFCVKRRTLFKDDMSCVCARTRPLVAHHKPRLFRLSPVCNNNSSKCCSHLSGLTSRSCSYRSSSCAPVLLSSDVDCSSNETLPSRTCSSNGEGSAREEWSQIPLVLDLHDRKRSSTPVHNSHTHTELYKKSVLGLSPIRQPGCLRQKHRKVHQRKKKRRRRDSVTEDDNEDSFWEDSSDEVFEENDVFVSQKQSTRGAVHRRHGESMFNIDNFVIPSFLTKVEKLQYKAIDTPSWQAVDLQALMKNEDDSEKGRDEQMEILTDEVFAQRHLPLEQKEKRCWSFWVERRCSHSRSGNRLSSCDGVFEEKSVDWSFTQLDPDEQLSSEECLLQAPWERRVFPLNEEDEQALSSEVLQRCSNSDLIASQSTDTTPSSYGHDMDCSINEH